MFTCKDKPTRSHSQQHWTLAEPLLADTLIELVFTSQFFRWHDRYCDLNQHNQTQLHLLYCSNWKRQSHTVSYPHVQMYYDFHQVVQTCHRCHLTAPDETSLTVSVIFWEGHIACDIRRKPEWNGCTLKWSCVVKSTAGGFENVNIFSGRSAGAAALKPDNFISPTTQLLLIVNMAGEAKI